MVISNFLSNKRLFFGIRNFISAYKPLNYEVTSVLNAINFIKDFRYFYSVYLLIKVNISDSFIWANKTIPHNHRGLLMRKTNLNYVIINLAGAIATLCIYFISLRALDFCKYFFDRGFKLLISYFSFLYINAFYLFVGFYTLGFITIINVTNVSICLCQMAGGDKNHFLIFFFLLIYMSRNKSNRNGKFIFFFLIIFIASKLSYQMNFFHQADIQKELKNCRNTDSNI